MAGSSSYGKSVGTPVPPALSQLSPMLGQAFQQGNAIDPTMLQQIMSGMPFQQGQAVPQQGHQPIAGVDMPMPHLMQPGAAPGGSGGNPPMGGVPGALPAPPMPERKPGPGAVDEDPMTWDTQVSKGGLFKRLLDAARSMSAPDGGGSPGPGMMPFRRQGW